MYVKAQLGLGWWAVLWWDIEAEMKQQIDAVQTHAQDKIDQAEQEAKDSLMEMQRLEELLKQMTAKDIATQNVVDEANKERNKTEAKLTRVETERDIFKSQLVELKADNKDARPAYAVWSRASRGKREGAKKDATEADT